LGVSPATAYNWLARYRQHGPAGLADRSSRPRRCPHALPASQVRRVLAARRRHRQGPHRLAWRLGMARSTIYGILRRYHMSRLAHTDRTSGVIVRYQREHPGELVHLDVKKLGRIPDGGGHRGHGRAKATRGPGHRLRLHPSGGGGPLPVAFSQLLPDETGRTATDLAIKLKRTRRYRPQTNGKVERFHRTLLDEWAYARLYHSNTERTRSFTRRLWSYKHRRPHTALDGLTPMAVLVNNAGGENS
jgi:hypothetical protein